jgi:hypothetical protein
MDSSRVTVVRAASHGTLANREPRALVVGWFSFEHGHATAGDVEVRDVVCEVLRSLGLLYDVAAVPPFGDFDWRETDPRRYSHVVFACGPFGRPPTALENAFLRHFHGNLRIGINLSMLVPVEEWNPFHILLERDSTNAVRADLSFASKQPTVPVVGVCLLESIGGSMVEEANAAVTRLVSSREMAVVSVDTRLDQNSAGLRSPAEIESLIGRLDTLITTRLHGTAFAIKMGVPVIAIDPVPGGGKISSQAKKIGWPIVFGADRIVDRELSEALEFCLADDGRRVALECGRRAKELGVAAIDEMTRTIALTLDPEHVEHTRWTRVDGPRAVANHRPSLRNTTFSFIRRVSRWVESNLR